MNYDTAAAVACLASVFLEVLEQDFPTLKLFEDEVIDLGHDVMAKARVIGQNVLLPNPNRFAIP